MSDQENQDAPLKLRFNAEIIRDLDPASNKIFNQMRLPSMVNSSTEIFTDMGLLIGNQYRIKAQPYEGVFLLHIWKLGKGEFRITYSLSEIINKGWIGNTKLNSNMKKVLDFLHEKYVIPKIGEWERALKSPTFNRRKIPLLYQQWEIIGVNKVKSQSMVTCTLDQKPKSITIDCMLLCKNFIRITKDGIECKRVKKIQRKAKR